MMQQAIETIARSPGWHRLPSGVAARTDETTDKYLNPEGMLNEKLKEKRRLASH